MTGTIEKLEDRVSTVEILSNVIKDLIMDGDSRHEISAGKVDELNTIMGVIDRETAEAIQCIRTLYADALHRERNNNN